MRILFLTPPLLKSHLYVLAPLASALRTAGHEVRVACQPDLVEDIARSGLTAVPVGEPMAQAMEVTAAAEPAKGPSDHAGGANPVQTDYTRDDPQQELDYLVKNLLSQLCPDRTLDDLVAFTRSWRPDLVVWDALCYAGAVAARASGAAHARILFGTDAFVQLHTAAREQRGSDEDDPFRVWLEPLLARFGCDYGPDMVTGQWTIDTMPSWTWRPEGVHYLPMRHLAFNGPSTVPSWLDEEPRRPRVCLTLGMSHRETQGAEASASALLEAVAGLDVEVVATLDAGQLESMRLPDNVRAVEFVPLNVLLPTCSAIVHHGGSGTVAAALEHAVPQLIVPAVYWSDKFYGPVASANGLEEQGAGIYVADSDRLTAADLRAQLDRVLSEPSFEENARRLSAEAREVPTPNDLVPLLEGLTGRFARPARPTKERTS